MINEILNFIEACVGTAGASVCLEIERAAKARQLAIHRAEHDRAVKEYWARAVYWREGQTVYCAASGIFVGGPLQRGDKARIAHMEVDRRQPRIWLALPKRKHLIGFSPEMIFRYQLAPEKPLGKG